jgi:hypothetical protein
VKGACRKSGIREVRSSRQREPRNPEPRYRVGDNHGQVLRAVEGKEGPVDWNFFTAIPLGNLKEPLRLRREEGI